MLVWRFGEGALGRFARGERFITGAGYALGAQQAVCPIIVDAGLGALPDDVVFLLFGHGGWELKMKSEKRKTTGECLAKPFRQEFNPNMENWKTEV